MIWAEILGQNLTIFNGTHVHHFDDRSQREHWKSGFEVQLEILIGKVYVT